MVLFCNLVVSDFGLAPRIDSEFFFCLVVLRFYNMCLAVPGKITLILNDDSLLRSGVVAFGNVEREVNLAFVPDAEEGMYVLVHAGIAISTLEYAEAMQTLSYLEELKGKVST